MNMTDFRSIDHLGQLARRAYLALMTRAINLYEAKTHLSALVDAAARGEEIVIVKNGVAKARLVAAGQPRRERKPSGLLRIRHTTDDFDAPDDEIIRLFEGDA
ncbi:MAG: type II toxin-antitoxin system prevent-host-death family antitoxin [Roseiarcus sp.]